MPGQSCAPCECNGNVNPQEEGHCDPFTGQCLKCLRNTAGHHCEKCADGYFGDAVIDKNCRGKMSLLSLSTFKEHKNVRSLCKMDRDMCTFAERVNLQIVSWQVQVENSEVGLG